MDEPVGNLEVLRFVVSVFDELELRYAIGGSFASSAHGEPRFTRDVDISVEPFPGREPEFVGHFSQPYYVSQSAVEQANADRSCFNLIHTTSGFKVDVFVHKDRAFDVEVLDRRRLADLGGDGLGQFYLVSPEDIVLLKLEWFRLGGETSEQQWRDVLGLLRTQGEALDRNYLGAWSTKLDVNDLLSRALEQARD